MRRYLIISILMCLCAFSLFAQTEYRVELQSSFSSGDNSPFWSVSNKHGLSSLTKNNGYLRAGIVDSIQSDKKIDLGYGLDIVSAYNFRSDLFLHQAYLELKYKKILLTTGSKEYESILKNNQLSCGGLSWSGNASPIPQIRLSVPEFLSFPWLMNNQLKVKGDISYGWFTDADFQKKNCDLYIAGGTFYNSNVLYHHKSLVIEYTFKNSPFSLDLGLESKTQFGGKKYYYDYQKGCVVAESSPVSFKYYLMALVPMPGDSQSAVPDRLYMYGNTLGSWHVVFNYHKGDATVRGYLENYFDDFSGMAKENGFDGLWGLEYTRKGVGLTGILLEYLQTTNQSGPIHWAPNDYPGTNLKNEATGNDDYYNNYYYVGWENYGMACGNPLLTSPAYNKNGNLMFENNRVKAFHLGFTSTVSKSVNIRILTTYSKGWGRHYFPYLEVKKSFMSLCDLNYSPGKWKGWTLGLSAAFDRSPLYGNNQGVILHIKKAGSLFSN